MKKLFYAQFTILEYFNFNLKIFSKIDFRSVFFFIGWLIIVQTEMQAPHSGSRLCSVSCAGILDLQ